VACTWGSPVEALNAILICAQGALAGDVPTQVVVGTAGIGDPYGCCDGGLLVVAWETSQHPFEDLAHTTTSGVGCRERVTLTVLVSLRRCTATYALTAGGTIGTAVSPEDRTAAGVQLATEAWAFLTAFTCCQRGAWEGCDVEVVSQDLIPVSGQCFGHDTVLTVTLGLCCP